jgi:catechol 2,3-dioxygenase-like lactoylglutathione lyase family enzyme
MPLFWTDSIVVCYSNVNAAKRWWIEVFDCSEAKQPSDWDNPLPSDVALKLPGEDSPSVLLSSASEVQHAGLKLPTHAIIFTGDVKKSHKRLRERGGTVGPVRDEGGTQLFEISDPEGHLIEICKEP